MNRQIERAQERTIGEVVQARLAAFKEAGSSEESIYSIRLRLERILPPEPISSVKGYRGQWHTPWSALDADMAQALYDHVRKSPRKPGNRRMPDTTSPISVAYSRAVLADLKALCAFARERTWMERDKLQLIREVRPIGRANKGKAQLRLNELVLWLQTAQEIATEYLDKPVADARKFSAVGPLGRRDGAVAAMLALVTTIRASGICRLQVRDVDDEVTMIVAPRVKSDASMVRIEIPPFLRPILADMIAGREGKEWLFGTVRHRTWVREWVRKICAAAKVPMISTHGLRGTHSSITAAAGTTAHALMQQLGHASESMTFGGAYATQQAIVTGRLKRLTDLLGARMGPQSARTPTGDVVKRGTR